MCRRRRALKLACITIVLACVAAAIASPATANPTADASISDDAEPDPPPTAAPTTEPTTSPEPTDPTDDRPVQLELERPNQLSVGASLLPGETLVSPGHRFSLVMRRSGNLVELASDGQREWSTDTRAPGARAKVRPNGAFVVISPEGQQIWKADGSGGHFDEVRGLELTRDGALHVRGHERSVLWTNHLSARCAAQTGRVVVISISYQHLWACRGRHLVLSTPITTGATARGWATPTGSWRVYAKQREVNLVGASWNDHVHYWMPYSGPYGIHDATWQHFPEGSPKYTSRGSHGCTHVPLREMRQIFAWAAVGTRVTVRS